MSIAGKSPPWLADFAGAWVFYSVLPGLPWVEPSFRRIARFAPWIGLTLGAIQVGFWLLLTFLGWPSIAVAPLLGLRNLVQRRTASRWPMDTADGFAAGRSRRLEAMEDSRVGASGVLALAMVLLIEMGALIQLGPQAPVALLLAAIGARAAPLWAMAHFDYLRQDGLPHFTVSTQALAGISCRCCHWQCCCPGWCPPLVMGTLVALLSLNAGTTTRRTHRRFLRSDGGAHRSLILLSLRCWRRLSESKGVAFVTGRARGTRVG